MSRRQRGVGDTFGGYTLESELGRGGVGTVYLATHDRLERKVALKVIVADLAHDEDFRARFLREARLAASLDHPNVIPIYDAGEADDVLFLAMRYVPGESLQQVLAHRGALSAAETVRITRQVGGALDAAHAASLVHRDVKPANILLAGPGGHVYLCDFGLAKRMSSPGTTRTGVFLGTADYCAPEQIEGRELDARADVYSLGGVVFHCLTGRPPFARESEFAVLQAHLVDSPPSVSELRPELPPAVDPVVDAALAKRPEDRYPSAAAFTQALEVALDTTAPATRAAPGPDLVAAPTRVHSTEVLQRTQVSPRRYLPWATAAALAFILIAAVAFVVSRGSSGSGTDAQAAAIGTFLDRMENVLDQSAAGRREIRDALAAGLDCSIAPAEAARRIGSVADNRQSILGQLGSLATPTTDASNLVTLLQRALQESIEADRHYRDGFLAVGAETTCPPSPARDFALAAAADKRATAAKARFAARFDELAKQYDRRQWAPEDF